MDNLINHEVVLNCSITQNENTVQITTEDGFSFRLSSSMVNQNLLAEENVNGSLKLTFSFAVDCTNGKYHVAKSNDLSLAPFSLKVNNEDLIDTEMSMIDFYQHNDSAELDKHLIQIASEAIDNGSFDDQFRRMPKEGMDWSEAEAKIVYQLYRDSKRIEPTELNNIIQRMVDLGKINRTISAIKYKLAHFKNLESGGEEGLGNIGKVFVDVFNSKGQ